MHLGIDDAAYVRGRDGHLIQLYYFIEQPGRDGRPRLSRLRPSPTTPRPADVDAHTDTHVGQAISGPPG